LDFALGEIPSFGVGRIRSLFVYPLGFDEFLTAMGEDALLNAKQKASVSRPLAEPLHLKLLTYLKRFLVLGGMPEVIRHYRQNKDMKAAGQLLDDLIISFRADFAKYKHRVPSLRISEVFDAVVRQSGGKFVYAKAATEANHKQVKEAVDLLVMSGLVVPVTHSAANGLPLGAESNPKKQKMMVLDTGIFQRILGLDITEILFEDDFDAVNKGAIAEQYCGLELLKAGSCYRQERLYYWHREALNSNAEVDYLFQKGQYIIPLEVKSGKKGSMQSLHLFLKEKKCPYGIRFSNEPYAAFESIQVWPLYAVSDFVKEG
jgi:predicted AAA+ superfamily ATPase